jgi:micrococcal nuclease
MTYTTRLSLLARSTAALAAAVVAISLLGSACAPTRADTDITATATVLRVVDGDTVDVMDDGRGRLRIRIIGIDSPEVHRPGYSVGCWGPQATDFARSTLAGQRVAIVTDPSQDSHDRYGRTLAYLDRPGGWDFSVEAARVGAARVYVYGHHPAARTPEIEAAESEARQAGRGLWGPPCNGRTESVPVQ